MELVGGNLPASALHKWNDDSVTHRTETATAELRDLYQAAENGSLEAEHVKGLEQATRELCREAREQLRNDNHLLLIPCLSLHLDCCDLVQRLVSLSSGQRSLLLARTVESAQQLVALQKSFHGADHFDLARTWLDLAHATEELLSRSPKQLLSLKLDGLDTIPVWSALAHKARKEHNRIKALYPYDTDSWISNGGTTEDGSCAA